MTPASRLLAACLLLGACTPAALPTGTPVPDAVVRFALDYAFAPPTLEHGPVVAVDATCADPATGTIRGIPDPDTGVCRWGLTLPGEGTWISIEPGARLWSKTALCHEVAGHVAYGDALHSRSEIWGPNNGTGVFLGGLVGGCMQALSLHPDLDVMQ